jgi:flagellar biosynthetic protein FlhB
MAEGKSEDDESKIHDPTPKRLEELRRKGDIPRSADMASAVGYAGVLLALVGAGGWIAERLGTAGARLIGRADALAPLLFDGHGSATGGAVLALAGTALAPLFGLPAALVVAALLAQRALVFTPDKLAPKLSRVSPVKTAQQKFGVAGLVEFLKSFAKLVVYSTALGLFVAGALEELTLSTTLEPRPVAVLLGRLAVEFLAIVVAISLAIGAIDLVWQIAEHRRRNRMSHKELKDEMKESEGDPYLKERRRQKGRAIASDTMLAQVPEATVVLANPTHYAVALQWGHGSPGAPLCIAKGVDAVALRIRDAAESAGVPVRDDPPTARALYAAVEIGEEVGREHYVQVAAAIRFAEEVRARARRSPL